MNTKTTPFEDFASEMRAITAKMRMNGVITVIPSKEEDLKEAREQVRRAKQTREEKLRYQKEYDKQIRDEKKRNGFCILHRKANVPVMEGKSLCENCLTKARNRYKPKNQRQTRYRRGES